MTTIKKNESDFLEALNKISTYRCFVFNQIVRYETMEAASKILNLPLSKLQTDMKVLEKALQDPLMLHNQQRFVLTEVGKKFADFSRTLVDNFELRGEKFCDKPMDIVIGCYYGLAESILPEVVSEFAKLYPDIRIFVHSGVEYSEFTNYDLDVLIGPPLSDLSDINCINLKKDPHYLYASPEYIEKYGEPISYEDFKKHKLLLFHEQKYYPKEIFDNNKPFLTTTSMGLIYEMAKLGQGIAALPISRLQSDDLCDKKLVEIVKGMECYNNTISFMTRQSPNKKHFTDILLEIFNIKLNIKGIL